MARFGRRRKRAGWVRELSREQRRKLRENLEALTEPKRSNERLLNAGAPRH
jgi:hypothetical protein